MDHDAAGPAVDADTATGTSLTLDDAMRRALVLAARGPAGGANPQVGAVLLAPGAAGARTWDASPSTPAAEPAARVLGEGWHQGAGTPHAEVAALAAAAAAGNDVRGATAVVSLQPCHTWGRTGPCTQALLDAGVARVVFAVTDPAADAAGSTQALEAAGVQVRPGLLEAEGTELLRPWLVSVATGRPYVTLKLATTLDGRVAAPDGTSRWITGEASRAHAHGVRARVGAVLAGTGTVLRDDPALTARTPEGALAAHQPLRVVVGSRAVPPGARLHGPGGALVQMASHDVTEVLDALQRDHEIRHVLVEGGPTVATAFLAAGAVDEVLAYVAPVLLGAGPHAVGDLGVRTIGEALRGTTARTERLGDDVLLTVRLPHAQGGGTGRRDHLEEA